MSKQGSIGAAIRLAAIALFSLPGSSLALTTQQCVSNDNHVYLMVTTNSSNIGTQVTSVVLNDYSPCSLAEIGPSGTVLTAFSAGVGSLLPNRMRTTVLSGFATNSINCASNFDPAGANGQGTLALPPPGGRVVSVDPAYSTEVLVPVSSADANVPAALDIVSANRTIISFATPVACSGALMAFPLGGSANTISNSTLGEINNQAITFDDTSGSRVGNGPPGNTSTTPSQVVWPDGFLLEGNCAALATCQIIVFTASQGGASSFGVAAAGFTVDGSLIQLQTEAAQQNALFHTPGAPSPTPTDTPQPLTSTPVPTETPLPPTDTPLPIATDTPPPPTETPLPIATDTPLPPTETPLPIATDTPLPPTQTPLPTSTGIAAATATKTKPPQVPTRRPTNPHKP